MNALETDKASFIRNICEDPFKDTPRLICADWLEEFGNDFERNTKVDRIRDCLRSPTSSYMRSSLKSNYQEIINRGFVSIIRTNIDYFMKHAVCIFTDHPVTEVYLFDTRPRFVSGRSYENGKPYIFHDDCGFHQVVSQEFGSIPAKIMELMPDPELTYFGFHRRVFETEAEALKALSRACVDYGRNLAGLPKLDWSKEI